jgi:hypothetical protein
MKKIMATKKRRSPGVGRYPLVAIRIPPELIERIDDYATKHKISRSEALRTLAVFALDRLKS